MLINKIEKKMIDDKITYQAKVITQLDNYLVKFNIDNTCELFVDDQVHDSFLLAVLLNAMDSGEDIHIEGVLSEKLYYNVTNFLIPAWQSIIPGLKKVRILPDNLRTTTGGSSNGVATGCSGGVDSFYSIAYHLNREVPESYKLTHLLYNAHLGTEKMNTLAEDRYNIIKMCADSIGLPLVRVDTNFKDFSKFNYQASHHFWNISSVLLLQNLFSKYYYSSGISYIDCHLDQSNDPAYSDPFTIHLFSTEKVTAIPFGGQVPRTEKTRQIADYEASQQFLNVCVDYVPGAKNCSVCRKCCRTLLTLEILGYIDKYSRAFDLKKYKKVRSKYLFKILRNKNNSLNRELLSVAKSNKFHISCKILITSKAYNILFPYFLEKWLDRRLRSLKKQLSQR